MSYQSINQVPPIAKTCQTSHLHAERFNVRRTSSVVPMDAACLRHTYAMATMTAATALTKDSNMLANLRRSGKYLVSPCVMVP